MSSSTPSRRRRGRVLIALLGVAAVMGSWPAVPAGAVPLSVVTVFPDAARHVSMVVDVGAGTDPVQPGAVTVTVSGVGQPTTVVPVLSDRLSTGLVIDASTGPGNAPQTWLSGAARFALEAPPASRTAVIVDGTPPTVAARLQPSPVDAVRALSAVQPHGARHTSDALTLAVRQLPADPAAPRLLVLYTGAADAGGEPAADLGARLRDAHTILVVVSTTADTRYWSDVTHATGGFLAPAGPAPVTPAFDQVATLLRARYLLTMPTPDPLPALVSVRVDAGQVTLTADAVVPAPVAVPRPGRSFLVRNRDILLVLALLLLVAVLTLVARAAVPPLTRRLPPAAGRWPWFRGRERW
jgi:hypothetical protein